jgi:hypothetical protein
MAQQASKKAEEAAAFLTNPTIPVPTIPLQKLVGGKKRTRKNKKQTNM